MLKTTSRAAAVAMAVAALVMALLIGTAVAGLDGADHREALVTARVWCHSLIERDALRHQEAYRSGHFRGRFDRAANLYREPTEASILAKMPATSSCRVDATPRGPNPRGEIYVDVQRTRPDGTTESAALRMRTEAGFWVVYSIEPR